MRATSNKVSNWPPNQQPAITEDELAEDIRLKLKMMEQPAIDLKDAAQIRQRIIDYFQLCADNRRRPGVEGMCLSLGTSRQNLWNWQHEHTERGHVIRQAKQLIIAMLESWQLEGSINPVSAIFLLKNHGAYRDQVQIEAVNGGSPMAERTPAEIARIIEDDIPLDDMEV